MMIDPKAKLIDILRRNTLISRRTDRGERELYERIVPLYLPRRLRVR